MSTIIYLIRHSEKAKINYVSDIDNYDLEDEKLVLSVLGEEKAHELVKIEELQSISKIYTSNYSRSLSTAKYLAEKLNLKINVLSALNERKIGIEKKEDYPYDFEEKQFLNENYKLNGESQKEVRNRMKNVMNEIIQHNENNTIGVFSHATAIIYYLLNFCEISYRKRIFSIKFNNKIIFNERFSAPEIFRLEFNSNKELIDIKNIKLDK